MNNVHEIIEDVTSSGLERVSCDCGSTIVKQPWMTDADWLTLKQEFEKEHT